MGHFTQQDSETIWNHCYYFGETPQRCALSNTSKRLCDMVGAQTCAGESQTGRSEQKRRCVTLFCRVFARATGRDISHNQCMKESVGPFSICRFALCKYNTICICVNVGICDPLYLWLHWVCTTAFETWLIMCVLFKRNSRSNKALVVPWNQIVALQSDVKFKTTLDHHSVITFFCSRFLLLKWWKYNYHDSKWKPYCDTNQGQLHFFQQTKKV